MCLNFPVIENGCFLKASIFPSLYQLLENRINATLPLPIGFTGYFNPREENKCATIGVMNTSPTQMPDKPNAGQDWLVQEQQRLAEKVGEPIFITIRLVYDGEIEVEVETCTGRHGMAWGDSVLEALSAAIETLLYLDEITGLSAL